MADGRIRIAETGKNQSMLDQDLNEIWNWQWEKYIILQNLLII